MNTKGLIVLIPYCYGKDFYQPFDDDYYDEDEEDDEKNKVYTLEKRHFDDWAYLPTFVETEDRDLALMVMAYEVFTKKNYFTNPAAETKQEWKERGFSGTINKPKIQLPAIHPAFDKSNLGEGLCCGSLRDYKVVTPEEMVVELKKLDVVYCILSCDDYYEELLELLNVWCVKFLGYSPE